MNYQIGDWLVQQDANRLLKGNTEVQLEPKAMTVLCYLAANAERAVKREELESACWPGQVVGYDALSNSIIKIRKALRDNARKPVFLETVHKTGFRLIASVSQVTTEQPLKPDSNPDVFTPNPSKPSKPLIAVLPFHTYKDSIDGNEPIRLAGDLLAEEIIVSLSRQSEVRVISRSSSFQYREKFSLKHIANNLNADHVIEGSIVEVEDKFDIRVTLNNCQTTSVTWAGNFHSTNNIALETINPIISGVISSVLAAIGVASLPSINKGTQNEAAYCHFLKGRELDRRDTPECNQKARQHFLNAIELDARFSSAHSYLSRNLAVCIINQWPEHQPDQLNKALDHADLAIALDPQNPHGYFAKAASTLWLRAYATALTTAATALNIDPSFSEAHAVTGMIHLYNGDPFKALEPLETAMHLDPYYRDAYQHIQAQAYFHLREYSKAEQLLRQRLLRKPDSDTSRVLLAATYGHLGENKKALNSWHKAMVINPDYSIAHKQSILPYRKSECFEQLLEGLQLAGISSHR